MGLNKVARFFTKKSAIGLLTVIGSTIAIPQVQAAILLQEGFDDITTLSGSGWVMTNNSASVGATDWFQGNAAVFPSQAGTGTSYIAANFLNASFGGNISNWLISPVVTLDDGDTIEFYTRTDIGASFADRLELRLSANGASADVGTTDTSVGDFTTALLTINPSLNTGSGSYPDDWTLFSATISGLGASTLARFAFRYDVPDTSVNGNYIGIDSVAVTEAATSPVPEPATLALLGIGLAGLARRQPRPPTSA